MVALSASGYSAAQNAGFVTITVNRTGGGGASVSYATANISAVAGTDYSSTSGSLSWGNHDDSPKSFVIPISNAGPFAGTKTFAVAIAGASGVSLGTTTSAIVTINGDAGSAPVASPPTVSISASPTSVSSGGASTLTWSATNATSCAASGAWNGTEGVSGTYSTGALSSSATYTLTCTGAGGSVSHSATVMVSATPPTVSISASPTTVPSGGSTTLAWSATNAATCTASGDWSGSMGTQGTDAMGNITSTKTYTMACNGTGGTTTQSTTVSVAASGGTVSRPSYNTGNGFFVLNGKLYDPNGNEFRMRGVDRNHYDSNSSAGIAKSGANAVRIFVETDYGQTWSGLANIVQTQHVANKQVPVITFSMNGSGTNTSCNSTTAVLTSVVNNWVNSAAVWAPFNKNSIFNIANEWGPSNSTVWRDAYISAIASMRAAGYSGTLLIDAGGCGQDPNDLMNYAAAVFNSDPQKNVMFAFHFYGLANGYSTVAQMDTIFSEMAGLSQTYGMAFAITEFGPGKDIGPSPTMVTPGQVITAAETNGLGWLAWAWDDNDLGSCQSDNNWFSMTYNCGVYTQTSDLTTYGQDVVLNPTYGITALAKPATIF